MSSIAGYISNTTHNKNKNIPRTTERDNKVNSNYKSNNKENDPSFFNKQPAQKNSGQSESFEGTQRQESDTPMESSYIPFNDTTIRTMESLCTEIQKMSSKIAQQEIEIKELTNKSKEQEEEIKNLQTKLEEKNKIIDDHERREEVLQKLNLFDISIGNIIDNAINGDEMIVSLEEELKDSNPDVIRFYTTEDLKVLEFTQKENEDLKQIRNELSEHFNSTIKNSLESFSLKFTEECEPINENLIKSNGSHIIEIVCNVLNKHFEEYKKTFYKEEELRQELLHAKSETEQLETELNEVRGNEEERLTLKTLKHPKITALLYESLNLDSVEKYNMIQLQNIVKQTSIEIGVELNSLDKNLPRVNILLECFFPLLKFVTWFSKCILEVDIDFHKFVNKAIETYVNTGSKSNSLVPFKELLNELSDITCERFEKVGLL